MRMSILHSWNFYKANTRQSFLGFLQYRVAAYSWLVGKVLEPLIYMVIWTCVINNEGSGLKEYTQNYFVTYYVILMVVNQFTFTDLIWNFGKEITDGDFANKLILPIHPLHHDLSSNIGYKIFSMPVIIISAITTSIAFKADFDISLIKILVFIPALLFAFGIRFLFEWIIALSAFWVTNTQGVNSLYYVAILFFSGRVIPLDLFSRQLKIVAEILPFKYMIAFPTEIIISNFDYADIFIGLLIQFLWLMVAIILMKIVYKLGIKRHSAVGG